MFRQPSLQSTLYGALALLIFASASNITAQTTASAPTATAAATGATARFTTLGETASLRLELFAPGGERVFDSGFKAGSFIDWTATKESGLLTEGAYLCVLTSKNVAGHFSQHIGIVMLQDGRTVVRAADESQLDAGQREALAASRKEQAIDAAQSLAPLTIVSATESPAVAVVAHDGEDARVVSTQGGLSLRTGDFFTGQDAERMRITPDGRVGIGTDKPEATLDVAGTIRARSGFQFADGSTLTLAPQGGLSVTSPAGQTTPVNQTPNAVAGTAHRLPKFDTNGTSLVDSAFYQDPVTGFIGWGTTTPQHPFVVRRNGGNLGVHSFGEFFVDRDNNSRSASLTVGTAGVLKWIFGMPSGDDGFQVFDLRASPAPGLSRFYVHPTNGNVGIGTNAPAAKLDVAGTIKSTGVDVAGTINATSDVNTSTQYNIGGLRVLSVGGSNNLFAGAGAGNVNTGTDNTFLGRNAGLVNSGGNLNTFVGSLAGDSNTGGSANTFVGASAGNANTTGNSNSFFGASAGYSNTASNNSFFGDSAGLSNTTGSNNSFFGTEAGQANVTTTDNSFFGYRAGAANIGNSTFGSYNSFFGSHAGEANTTGYYNSFFGESAGFSNTEGRSNSFFGERAGFANTTGSSNAFFGRIAGGTNTEGYSNSFFGEFAGFSNTEGHDNTFVGGGAGYANAEGFYNSFFGRRAGQSNTTGTFNTAIGYDANVTSGTLSYATAIGAQARVSTSNTIVLGRSARQDTVSIPGPLTLNNASLGTGGTTNLCLNPSNQVSSCSSSLRYKHNVTAFVGGLNLIRKLRPVTFRWNSTGALDVGFGAEDVARIAPLFVTRNAAGEIEGVKYGQLSAALVNAVQEQQTQIATQQDQLQRQQRELQARDARIANLETRLAALERVMLSPRRTPAQPRRRR